MIIARPVGPGKDRIDDAELRVRADALVSDTSSGSTAGMHQFNR